jgi:uncharacterized protein YbgA (DUF1722 family)/uncharacterized protein YbbK (DUF523 family)
MPTKKRIKLGISACLLGEKVRYDGGHKLDRFLTDTFGQYVDYVPVCPEVECGLGTPREAMHLEGDPENPRLVTTHTHIDQTDHVLKWAKKRVRGLKKENLAGFIFKSRSPSSGMQRVKVYNKKGMPSMKGRGIFARAFMEQFPRTPAEEEGRLHDPKIRENFVERVFTLKRWRETIGKKTLARLIDFHTRNKLLILSHSEKHYRKMGRMVAEGKTMPLQELFVHYEISLMDALRLKTTTRKNINVLQHMIGFFKKDLPSDEKQELLEIIQRYREGAIPIIVPVTLFNHFARKYHQPYLEKQTYLNPHPIDLQLRNHV